MKELRNSISDLQIAGASVSVIATLVLWFTGNDSLASLSVGLLVAILTQLIEIQVKQQGTEKHIVADIGLLEEHVVVSDKLLKRNILKGISLSDRFFNDSWFSKQLEIIVTDYYSITDGLTDINDYKIQDEEEFIFFDTCRKNAIIECKAFIHNLTEGYALLDHRSPLYDKMEKMLFGQAKHTIDSVAVIDMKYWIDDFGQSFLSINKEAVAKGAKITRIFVYPKDRVGEIKDILSSQLDAKFTVLFVPKEKITADLQHDYHIIDGKVLTSLQTAIGTETITDVLVSRNIVEVEKWKSKFDITKRYAQVVTQEFLNNLEDKSEAI